MTIIRCNTGRRLPPASGTTKTNVSIDWILRKTFLILLLPIMVYGTSIVEAKEFQSLPSIRLQAERFILQYPYKTPYPPIIEINQLDRRLKLKPCPNTLLIDFTHRGKNHGNTALTVRCHRNSGWKLLLPVHIELFDNVLIAARPLFKGQIIDDKVVKFQKQSISRLNNGYFSQAETLSGLEARHNLKRGAILTPANLRPRLIVKSGQLVTLILNFKGVQIKSSGRALRSARRGDIVKVRNSQSNKIVEGIVSGEAEVRVNI